MASSGIKQEQIDTPPIDAVPLSETKKITQAEGALLLRDRTSLDRERVV